MRNKYQGTDSSFWIFLLIAAFLLLRSSHNTKEGKPDDTAVKTVARQRLEDSLKDPGSLEIISEKVIRPGRYGSKVGYEATYRAKNSLGGYVIDDFYTE